MLPKTNNSEDLFSYLAESELLIGKRLDVFFNEWRKKADQSHPVLGDLIARFQDISSGGKRLRGLLVRLGYELAGGKNLASITTVAAAYEILHTFLLIHDDIIDKANSRRGKTSLHLQYQIRHKKLNLAKSANDYGVAMAMTTGDVGSYLFLKLFLESEFESDLKTKTLNYLSTVLINTGFGQALDIDLVLKVGKKESDVYLIHDLKTAQYTLVGPLVTGALLAGVNNTLIKKLIDFGKPLGLAFQIRDDVLGVYGVDEKTGKSAKSDIAEGKNTLLISYALKHANKSDLVKLKKIYGHTPVADNDLKTVQKVFKGCGALDYSNLQSEKLLSESIGVLGKMTVNEKHQRILQQLANFLVTREK